MKKLWCIFILTLCLVFSAGAEVFWLSPRGRKGGGTIPLSETLPGLENAHVLLREPVLINGKRFTLELLRSGVSFDQIIAFLRAKKINVALSSDTLRCSVRLKDGSVERLLIVRPPGRGDVSVFRIHGSPGVPQRVVWDQRLPRLPSGARALQVIELPARKSVYGVFDRNGTDPVQSFRQIDSELRAGGWQPAGNEASPLIGGKGDIYHHPRSGRIIWAACDPSGLGAFYCRSGK